MKGRVLFPSALAAWAAFAACQTSDRQGVSEADLRKAEPAEWLTYGGSYDEQRFSELDRITPSNVAKLGVAWTYEMRTDRGVEATPIVSNGVMYVTSAWSVVYALDAATGKQLWVYDPQVERSKGVFGCCDAVNRGVAIYGNKVFVGVFDGRLVALDAETGKELWSTITVDQSKPYTITGAPRVAHSLVLIGNGGADFGVRGYLSAYDANTGKLVWRFYTTPNPDKRPDHAASDEALARLANSTWGDKGAWRTYGGGGTVWDSIVYDAVNDQVIFGVGNAVPWNADVRDPDGEGDNLFVASIIAVDARTGKYKWHFQETPRDEWDYTATQPIILAELPLGPGGQQRRIVMQAPKNGFFYLLDAATGHFLSAIPFAEQTWTKGVDANGRPIFVEGVRYGSERPFLVKPGPFGAHSWHPMAFNPDLGLAYIPSQDIPAGMMQDKLFGVKPMKQGWGVNLWHDLPLEPKPGFEKTLRESISGRLIAWDPLKGKPRWVVEHANPVNGGVMATKSGLLFQGTMLGDFVAYDAETGQKLWSAPLYSGITAAPVTYEIDGQQYVAITAGWGTAFALFAGFAFDPKVTRAPGRVVAFKIGGTATVEKPAFVSQDATPKTKTFGTQAQLELGRVNYARNCMVCHGVIAISSGVLPDLRWSGATADADMWRAIVIDGVLEKVGMVSFKEQLSPADAEAVRAYVAHRANQQD